MSDCRVQRQTRERRLHRRLRHPRHSHEHPLRERQLPAPRGEERDEPADAESRGEQPDTRADLVPAQSRNVDGGADEGEEQRLREIVPQPVQDRPARLGIHRAPLTRRGGGRDDDRERRAARHLRLGSREEDQQRDTQQPRRSATGRLPGHLPRLSSPSLRSFFVTIAGIFIRRGDRTQGGAHEVTERGAGGDLHGRLPRRRVRSAPRGD